jgi:hypothetical protein
MAVETTENDAEIARILSYDYELVKIFLIFCNLNFLFKVLNRICSIQIYQKDQNHVHLLYQKNLKLMMYNKN